MDFFHRRAHDETSWRWGPGNQTAFALAVLAALAVMAGGWVAEGGPDRKLVEIDVQPRGQTTYLIDLNTATWTELAELPGIGERLAKRIVESRDLAGPFKSHDDLRRVRGIGRVKMETVRPHLHPLEPPR